MGSVGPLVGVLVIALLFFMSILLVYASRMKKCPSDRIMVIYGKTGGSRAARCVHGGAAFVWPIWQDYGYLSLRPMAIDIDLRNALCKQNIRLSVPSVFTVGVSTDPTIMNNAAERLFGQHPDAIRDLARDIIFGQLRLVIASMTIEAINADRETFLRNVEENVTQELNKVGIQLINVNITDIIDDSGYIEAIGKRAASGAINQARIDVAEEEKKGRIGEAEAKKLQRISVSKAEADAVSGEANAERDRRIAVKQADAEAAIGEADAKKLQRISVSKAEADALSGEANAERDRRIAVKQADSEAVNGENISAIEIAKSNALRSEQEAEAFRKAEAAKRIAEAQIEKAHYLAEQEAQIARANMEREKQNAEVIVPAEVKKREVEIEAEAEAEKLRREARGMADAIFAKLDAEARGNFEILKAKGEGFMEIIKACDADTDAAAKMLLIEKLEEIVKLQTDAIKNIKIDKVTVWEGGNGQGGKTSTANFLSGMLQSLPPIHDVATMAGIDLPGYLGKVKDFNVADKAADEIPKSK